MNEVRGNLRFIRQAPGWLNFGEPEPTLISVYVVPEVSLSFENDDPQTNQFSVDAIELGLTPKAPSFKMKMLVPVTDLVMSEGDVDFLYNTVTVPVTPLIADEQETIYRPIVKRVKNRRLRLIPINEVIGGESSGAGTDGGGGTGPGIGGGGGGSGGSGGGIGGNGEEFYEDSAEGFVDTGLNTGSTPVGGEENGGYDNSGFSDMDGDGTPDAQDTDMDGDGIPNIEDSDIDGDGLPNVSDPDLDGDGIPNSSDLDIDGDGMPNAYDGDIDGDGTQNEDDADIDNDGIENEDDSTPYGPSIPGIRGSMNIQIENTETLDLTEQNPEGRSLRIELCPSGELLLTKQSVVAALHSYPAAASVSFDFQGFYFKGGYLKLFRTGYQQRNEHCFTTTYSLNLEVDSVIQLRYELLDYNPINQISSLYYNDELIKLLSVDYQDSPVVYKVDSVIYSDYNQNSNIFNLIYSDNPIISCLNNNTYSDRLVVRGVFDCNYSDYSNNSIIVSLVYGDYLSVSKFVTIEYSDYLVNQSIYSQDYTDCGIASSLSIVGYSDRPLLSILHSEIYTDRSVIKSIYSELFADYLPIKSIHGILYSDYSYLSSFYGMSYSDRSIIDSIYLNSYNDSPLIKSITSSIYGDYSIVSSIYEWNYNDYYNVSSGLSLLYGDYSKNNKLFGATYNDSSITKSLFNFGFEGVDLAPIFDFRYSLLNTCEQLFSTGYYSEHDIMRSLFLASYAMNNEDIIILTGSCWIELNGKTIEVTEVSINADEGSVYYQCSATIINESDYRKFVVDTEFVVHLFGDEYHFVVDSKNLSRSIDDDGHLSAQMTIEGLSPVVRYAAPRATTLTKTWDAPTLLSDFIEELIGTVDYQVVDDYLPAYRLSAENAVPLELAKATMESMGAVIESLPDGSIQVRKLWPVSPPLLNTTLPDHTLNDDQLFSMSESPENNDWRNHFRIIDVDSSVQDTLEFVADEGNDLSGTLYAYPSPWRDALTIRHTRGTPIYLSAFTEELVEMTINTENVVEPELIEFQAGESSTRYPIESILSFTWLAADLGAVAFVAHTKSLKSSAGDGYSLAQIRYTTRRLKARTSSSEYTSAQYLLEEL